METTLPLLKYFGFVLATASTIWGTTHDYKTKDESGNVRITRAGKVAILLTFLGLLISAGSTYLDDQVKKKAANEQALKEQRLAQQQALKEQREALDKFFSEQRQLAKMEKLAQEQKEQIDQAAQMNELNLLAQDQRQALRELRSTQEIILAGQPLNRLGIVWSFKNVPPKYLTLAKNNDIHNRHPDGGPIMEENDRRYEEIVGNFQPDTKAIDTALKWDRRHKLLYPWISLLATGEWNDESSVLLLPLDTAASIILPLGRIQHSDEYKSASGSIEFIETFTKGAEFERTREAEFDAQFEYSKGGVNLAWSFPLGSLESSLDRSSSADKATVSFPDTIKLYALGSISKLPIDPSNFTKRITGLPKRGSIDPNLDSFFSKSLLRLFPNSIPNYSVTYEMTYLGRRRVVGEKLLEFEGVHLRQSDHYCDVAIWEGRKMAL